MTDDPAWGGPLDVSPGSVDVSHRLAALEARIGELEAREDIRRQLDAYARAVDLRDRDALAAVFTGDVEFVVTADGSVRHGWEELWRYLADLLAPMGPTLHYAVGAVDIAVDMTGGTAQSRHLGIAQHERDGTFVVAALTYEHLWRCGPDNAWRIARRAVVPWYFCGLDQILAQGWDPVALRAATAPPRWLPWSAPSWVERVDRAQRPA